MTELLSVQAQRLNSEGKLLNTESIGRVKTIILESLDNVAWSSGDVVTSPVDLPKGTRILGLSIYHSAFGNGSLGFVFLRVPERIDPTRRNLGFLANSINIVNAGGSDTTGSSNDVFENFDNTTTEISNVAFSLSNAGAITANATFKLVVTVALPG